MTAFTPDDSEADLRQLLKEILAEIRKTNKVLAEIRDIEGSRSR